MTMQTRAIAEQGMLNCKCITARMLSWQVTCRDMSKVYADVQGRKSTHPLYGNLIHPLALLLLAPLLWVQARHPLCKKAQLALDLHSLQHACH